MKSKFVQISEMNATDMIKAVLGGDQEQPQCGCGMQQDTDSNIGEFGSTTTTEQINISSEEDGGVNINMDVISLKLTPAIVEALKVYFSQEQGEDSEEESEGEENGNICGE